MLNLVKQGTESMDPWKHTSCKTVTCMLKASQNDKDQAYQDQKRIQLIEK